MIASCFDCLWIFDSEDEENDKCPKCGCTRIDGARALYGASVYSLRKGQKPWFDRKLREFTHELREQLKND